MKTTIHDLIIFATFNNYAVPEWDTHKHAKYTITIRNSYGTSARFPFYASIANPDMTKKEDLLSALSCIVRDADAGAFPFRDFCADFGYDEDSRKALKTWKTCKSMEKRLQRVLDGSIISLDTLYNDLSEY